MTARYTRQATQHVLDQAAGRDANARISSTNPHQTRRTQTHRSYVDSRHSTDAARDRRLPRSDEPCLGGTVTASGEKRARTEVGASRSDATTPGLRTSVCRASLELSRGRCVGSVAPLSKCSPCISSSLLGRYPLAAIHTSAGAAGGPNSGGRGGKHNSQSGRPHIHLLDGAQS